MDRMGLFVWKRSCTSKFHEQSTWNAYIDWLIGSFYFELIILSPWRKTLQQLKVKIDRSVITEMKL